MERNMTEQIRFEGEVALVTGGGAGIGRAICELLAERGAKVVINGNYRASGSGPEEELAAKIRAKGGEAVGVNGSVCNEEAARRMVQKAIDTYGRLDILVNNAGTPETKHFITEAPGRIFEEQMEVHVRGTLRVTREAWPHLIAAGHARVLTTSSATAIGGRSPDGWDMSYPVAKAAIFGVTRQLAGAGSEHGVKVNALMPWAASPMVKKALTGSDLGAWIESKASCEKVAASAMFLLHRDCPVTGQFISSAGGRVARIFYGQAPGYFNPEITPEDVRDHWNEIEGARDGDIIRNAIELRSMDHEFALLQAIL
jgi:NAD(P)-dependent dehydrogenase (short-subunit alcohol dehydrogenase family)